VLNLRLLPGIAEFNDLIFVNNTDGGAHCLSPLMTAKALEGHFGKEQLAKGIYAADFFDSIGPLSGSHLIHSMLAFAAKRTSTITAL
jgi:hypothetical protein